MAPGQAAAGNCWFLPRRWSFWRTGATPNTCGRAGRGFRGSLRGTEGATPLLFQPTPSAKLGPTARTTSERKATHAATRLRKLASHPHRPLGLDAPRSPRWHPRSLCQMAPDLLLLLGRKASRVSITPRPRTSSLETCSQLLLPVCCSLRIARFRLTKLRFRCP